jgi:hypothetical protein
MIAFTRIAFGVFLLCAATLAAALPAGAAPSSDAFQARFDLPRDPEQVLSEALSRDEFKPRAASWRERLSQWLSDLLRRVLEWLSKGRFAAKQSTPKPKVDWQIIQLIMMAAAGAALLFLAYRIVRSVRRRPRSKGRGGPSSLQAAAQPRTADLVLQDAHSAASDGRYSDAVVLLFRFVLLTLNERGLVTLHTFRTNREIVEALPRGTLIRDGAARIVPIFNEVRYGRKECDRADYESFLEECKTMTERL